MNTKTKFTLLICFALVATIAKGQFNADSIFIYTNTKQRCGTTANLWHYHRILDSTNASKIKLDNQDLTELKDIFTNTKRKKYLQQKHGGVICYAIVYNKGQKNIFAFESSLEFGRLVDLTNMKHWKLENQDKEGQKRLYKIIRKNCQLLD